MRKYFIMALVCILSLTTFATSMSAKTNEESNTKGTIDQNSSIEEVELVMEKYTYTEGGTVFFDVEKAKNDGQSEFIIESGLALNSISQEYKDYINGPEKTTGRFLLAKMSIPVYGNWCGPGHGSGSPIDYLDNACRQHDYGYQKYGYYDCDTDAKLIFQINQDYKKMGVKEKIYANAVKAYFSAQMKVRGCK
ncbi:hypothetical protein [Rossellomorea sp. YZS02]|uniref:hypothetical protein n=1 Tax=Rossellomorea sp. YZS02 TaxID=3097358 RepID=UPI002A10BDA9|nr:hypothetical protein [Rossellomorea sp. YZS02]MDX8345820.1 hypothetical protein [Rossellomorea sp. YZS02]